MKPENQRDLERVFSACETSEFLLDLAMLIFKRCTVGKPQSDYVQNLRHAGALVRKAGNICKPNWQPTGVAYSDNGC